MREPIPYAPIERASRDFQLDSAGGFVTLTFPSTPRWQSIGALVTTLVCASAITAGVVWINVQQAMLFTQFGQSPFSLPTILIGSAVELVVWWTAAAWVVWHHRRWVGAVTTLRAAPAGLVWERRSLRSYRFREFERTKITGLQVRPLRDIFRRTCVFDFYVQLREHRPMRWRITSRDPEFASRLRSAFEHALGLAIDSGVRQNPCECPI